MSITRWGAPALVSLVLSSASCDDMSNAEQGAGLGPDRTNQDAAVGSPRSDPAPTAQTPPTGAAAIEAWLARGAYRDWHCEPAPHAFRPPSPHGFNRICSNDLIADNTSGSADWPKGAAAVKELYGAADDEAPVGYAVYLKLEDDSAGGANWYWYERVPLDHPAAPPDGTGVVADGTGDEGPAKRICVGCHAFAGADATHTPSPGGRDQVYTPVP